MSLHIVLFEPEIPQNTGNIMRTCVAMNATLHLIKPLGFKLDEASLKRAGVNYIDNLVYFVYENYNDFIKKNKGKFYFLTRYGHKSPNEIKLNLNDETYFVFGKESTGIDKNILKANLDNCFRIPTTNKVRSLNLSNTVAMMAFYYYLNFDFLDLEKEEPEIYKGKDFLDNYLE